MVMKKNKTANYKRGAQTEYKVRTEFVEKGYYATRTAGSHSPADVIAWNEEHLYLIQTKRTRSFGGAKAFMKEFIEFAEMPVPNNVRKEYRIWQDRFGFILIWKNYGDAEGIIDPHGLLPVEYTNIPSTTENNLF
jgi:hypothetical protein